MRKASRFGRKRPQPDPATIRARHWLREALAAGYTSEALIQDYAAQALATEGFDDDNAKRAITRAWNGPATTRAN
jgi:hypothetical protein